MGVTTETEDSGGRESREELREGGSSSEGQRDRGREFNGVDIFHSSRLQFR